MVKNKIKLLLGAMIIGSSLGVQALDIKDYYLEKDWSSEEVQIEIRDQYGNWSTMSAEEFRLRRELDKAKKESQPSFREKLNDMASDAIDSMTEERKQEIVQSIQDNFTDIMTNPFKTVVKGGFLVGTTYVGVRLLPQALTLASEVIKHRLTTNRPPSWIEYTNYKPFWRRVPSFLKPAKNVELDAVLEKDVRDQLIQYIDIIKGIVNDIALGDPTATLANLLLYGEPGTGKTRVAEQLAEILDFYIVKVNASVFTMQDVGVQAVNDLFDFLARCDKKILLFVDEADALFASRDGLQSGSSQYAAINMFLQKLGTPNQNYIVVATTNYMSNIDSAMSRRFGYQIKMALPGVNARKAAFKYYVDKLFTNNTYKKAETRNSAVKLFTDAKLNQLAQATHGLSYAHIETAVKVIAALASTQKYNFVVTEQIINMVVAQVIHSQKNFDTAQEKKQIAATRAA